MKKNEDISIEENEGKTDIKKRNWTFLYYKEYEKPIEEIINIFEGLGVSAVSSPLHSKGEKGEEIKPHYHIILMFSGVKKYSDVLQLVQQNISENVKVLKQVFDLKNITSYLWHDGKANKEQLNKNDCLCTSSVNIDKLILDKTEKKITDLTYIFKLIDEKDIKSLHELLDVTDYSKQVIEVLSNSSYLIKMYLDEKKNLTKKVSSCKVR